MTASNKGKSVLDEYREVLACSPKDPGQIAKGLMGWHDGLGYYVCSVCFGRVGQRGSSHIFRRPLTAVWHTTNETCDLCGRS